VRYEFIEEGMYIQLYSDENIYLVFSDYGVLSITFNDEVKPLDEFKNLICKVFTEEEIEESGVRINENR
jgi:hypothetical protein